VVSDDGTTAEDADPALGCWQFHDLLFHARSRQGRHDGLVGATYPLVGQLAPAPALRPETAADAIALNRPDLERLQCQDPPFALVQERRRSVRQYAAEPITDRQLGEFLYRVARVRDCKHVEVETPIGPVRMDFALRPYPSGGALYELEVYLVVASCRGLSPGLYRYDGLGHRLVRNAGRTAEVERLLSDAALAVGIQATEPQVLLVLAARLPRVAWKYTGLAYALALKHAGVVIQTMYLAATAMGLAPCAVGLGDSDLFAQAAGVDYYAETRQFGGLLMKKISAGLLMAILTVGVALSPARAEDAASDLKALDAKLTKAFKDRDVKLIGKHMANDYILIDPRGGSHDKKHYLKHLAEGAPKFKDLKETDVKVRVFGDTGVVTGLLHVKGMAEDKEISAEYRWTRVYNKKGDEWHCVHEQHTHLIPKEESK
jgi:SagB-type dehydrogenase family enzyme